MKRIIGFVLMVGFSMMFSGCSSSGSGAANVSSSLTSDELAAVEAGLILDRHIAASVAGVGGDELLASVADESGALSYRRRRYRVGNSGSGVALTRGEGNCQVEVGEDRISIGLEDCSVKVVDGDLQIIRGNGSIIMVPNYDTLTDATEIVVENVVWQVLEQSETDATLLKLKNTRSGMMLVINELDDGTLTVTRDMAEVFSGRWAENGALELHGSNGKRFRYRYGKAE